MLLHAKLLYYLSMNLLTKVNLIYNQNVAMIVFMLITLLLFPLLAITLILTVYILLLDI